MILNRESKLPGTWAPASLSAWTKGMNILKKRKTVENKRIREERLLGYGRR